MKIAHVLWGFTSGGIETMLLDIVSEQVKSSEIAIFVINDKVETALVKKLDPRCKLYLYRRKEGSKNPMPILKYNIQLLGFNPDIIHFHYVRLVKMTFLRKVRVLTVHNAYSSCNDFNRYDKIFAISDAVRNYIKSTGYDATTIENGVPIKAIAIRETKNTDRCKYRFVQVGRLCHTHKGQHIMIEALNILINKMHFTDFSFDFIGDGESKGYLMDLVREYSLSDFIHFLGTRSRDYIYSHLKDYDVCIQPSVSEGFGLTVAEAMMAKVPVLVSNIPGTMEVIANGKYGRHFSSEDPHELATKIVEVCRIKIPSDEDLQSAWLYARDNYDVSMTASKYMDEYRCLLSGKTL